MRWFFLSGALAVFAAGAQGQEEAAPEEEVVPVEAPVEAEPEEAEAELPVAGEEAVGIPPIGPEEEIEAPPEEAAEAPSEAAEEELAAEAAVAEQEAVPSAVEAKPVRRPVRPLARELEPTLIKGLKSGESIILSSDKVRGRREVVSLVTESVTLQLLYTSDGLFQVLSLSGQQGDEVSFELVAGEKTLSWRLVVGKGAGRIKCWPLAGFTATAGQRVLSMELTSVSWAFALLAEDVGPDGLEMAAEGLTGVLHDGQRLDSRKTEEEEIVFVVSGPEWPREYTSWEMARIKWEDGPRAADEPRQPMHSPLRSWQTIFLPTIELEVLRPEDVSP